MILLQGCNLNGGLAVTFKRNYSASTMCPEAYTYADFTAKLSHNYAKIKI